MPDKVGTPRDYVLSRGYDIQLTIKDYDYSAEVLSVRIVSSVTAPYQIIALDLLIDPEEILRRHSFSKDPLKLKIRLKGRAEQEGPLEQVDFELLYLKTSSKAAPQVSQMAQIRQKDRAVYRVITVCRKPFKTISTLVNDVFVGKTIKEIIQELASKTDATLDLSNQGINNEPVDQVVIPPTTLYKAILYLDEVFGIFNGMLEVHCDQNNVLQIHNLNTEVNKAQTFTIYQIPLDMSKSDFNQVMTLCKDGKHFFTYSPLKIEFSGNTKFSLTAKQTKHIIKPKDGLYNIVDKNLDKAVSDFGVIYKYDKVDTDPITDRVKYYMGYGGFQDNETSINAKLAKTISNMFTTSFSIEKNLKILNLLNVGEPVSLSTKNLQYQDLQGKYILRSSDISFMKIGEWFPVANVNLFRSNNTVATSS